MKKTGWVERNPMAVEVGPLNEITTWGSKLRQPENRACSEPWEGLAPASAPPPTTFNELFPSGHTRRPVPRPLGRRHNKSRVQAAYGSLMEVINKRTITLRGQALEPGCLRGNPSSTIDKLRPTASCVTSWRLGFPIYKTGMTTVGLLWGINTSAPALCS